MKLLVAFLRFWIRRRYADGVVLRRETLRIMKGKRDEKISTAGDPQ